MKKILSDLRNRFKNFRYDPLDSLYFAVQTLWCSFLGLLPAWIYASVVNASEHINLSIFNLNFERQRAFIPVLCFIARNLFIYFVFMRRKVSEQYSSSNSKILWLKVGLIYVLPGEILRFILCCCTEYGLWFGTEVLQTAFLYFSGNDYTKVYIPYFFISITVLMIMYKIAWSFEKRKRKKMKNETVKSCE